MIWLFRTIFGLWLMACLIRDAGETVKVVRQLFRRRRPELPPAAPSPAVNYIAGVVLPAPHDPRWRLHGPNVYRFGDLVEVREQHLYVRADRTDSNITAELASGLQVTAYFQAIQSAMALFQNQLAAHRSSGLQLGPSLTDDEWRALERRLPPQV